MNIIILLCSIAVITSAADVSQSALYINKHVLRKAPTGTELHRITRQTPSSADQMVQNILQWIQTLYNNNNRKTRQNSLREYLPPSNTEKPRPFQPVTQLPTGGGGEEVTGYPLPGSSPQPPFPIFTSPASQTTGYPLGPSTGYPGPSTGYPSPSTGYPTSTPGYPGPSTGYPGPSTGYPGPSTGYPGPSTGYPSTSTGYPGPSTGYPGPSTGYPGPSTGYPGPSTGYPGPSTGYPGPSTGYPGPSTEYPGQETEAPEQSTEYSGPSTGYPGSSSTGYPGGETTPTPLPIPTGPPPSEIPTDRPGGDGETGETTLSPEEEEKHPPHIHAIDVECAKDMMTINIEFNKVYNGIIYSKGFYKQSECRYVNENSGKTKYTFTVNLNTCGTQFINAFDTEGQSYLENILVLQNEASIQEVWDTIRAVRCLWEGNLNKALSVALSVGMLNQELVTFSGDTAMARLDIQLGRGPFAPNANGLVKIGETMTLVVSVTGDPGFDILVRDCHAKDSASQNMIELTDSNGCVVKPKLFGAFQKTRETGNTGASIIAYAFFNAFKFPDVMDLVLECNVELCKTDCEVCPKPDQKIEPGRRRRDLTSNNETLADPVTIGKLLRVILPEDISDNEESIVRLTDHMNEGICLSTESFVISTTLLVTLLTSSCIFSAYIWLKMQRIQLKI